MTCVRFTPLGTLMLKVREATEALDHHLSLPQNDDDMGELEAAKELLQMAYDRLEMVGK